jgi:phospholipid-binding lipoprotein MlaA
MQKLLIALTAATLLAGCATVSGPPNPRDPWESYNRAMFKFNDNFDSTIIKPVVDVYTTVLPGFTRTWISNFFSNVGDVWVGVNNLLQGKPVEAASDAGRVLVNSTFGILGLVDVATGMGLQHHNEDFGQTLGRWGFEPGPYLVLPVLGPRDVRDSFGLVADIYGNPIGYMHDVRWRNSLWGWGFLDIRANLNDAQSLLDQAAIDRYTFVRESYLQRRRNLVYDGDPPPLPHEPDDESSPPAKDKVSRMLSPVPDAAQAATGSAAIADGTAGTVNALAGSQPSATAEDRSQQIAEGGAMEGAQKPQVRRVVYPTEVPAIPDLVTDRSGGSEPGAEAATQVKP